MRIRAESSCFRAFTQDVFVLKPHVYAYIIVCSSWLHDHENLLNLVVNYHAFTAMFLFSWLLNKKWLEEHVFAN